MKKSYSTNTTLSLISWNDTNQSIEARKVLAKIFEYYSSKDTIVHNYLSDHCKHILYPPVVNTGVSCQSIIENSNNINCIGKINKSYTPSKFPSSSGVYFVNNSETSESYVGSAINFRARWKKDYQDMYNDRPSVLHKALLASGIENYNWTIIKDTTNYLYDFTIKFPEYKMDYTLFKALQIITQYECRLYEQSFITAINPSFNHNTTVVFSFK